MTNSVLSVESPVTSPETAKLRVIQSVAISADKKDILRGSVLRLGRQPRLVLYAAKVATYKEIAIRIRTEPLILVLAAGRQDIWPAIAPGGGPGPPGKGLIQGGMMCVISAEGKGTGPGSVLAGRKEDRNAMFAEKKGIFQGIVGRTLEEEEEEIESVIVVGKKDILRRIVG
eukprot:CAMPEP_0168315170 /NCGR_PEP_ID=MMETSP0210-20121227/10371_1 /TAXON_ID=40633 /ORGANISM="Condylostoma magnum, Strain COL2" /LENGTH=171 /DNA_ID=CAMNT_0008286855 /DNA_START=44 /DNA_END=559 /DNA_ORIENTATION=-